MDLLKGNKWGMTMMMMVVVMMIIISSSNDACDAY